MDSNEISITLNAGTDSKKVLENVPVFVKFLPLLGIAGGLYYAFAEKKSASAYIGFAVVGAIVLSAPYNFYLLKNSEKLGSKKS